MGKGEKAYRSVAKIPLCSEAIKREGEKAYRSAAKIPLCSEGIKRESEV